MLKNLFTVILFLISVFYQSQTLEELDKMTEDYIEKTKYQEAIDLNIKNLSKFKSEKNREGIVAAYTNIGKLFCALNYYKESLKYLEEAKKNIKNVENPLLTGKLYLEYGTYYSRLDLDVEANKNFNKAIQYFKKAENSEKKQHYLFTCYISKWGYFEYIKQLDSSLVIQKKCLKEFPEEPMVYNLIAYRYIYSGTHIDSIKYCLDKANSLSPKGYHKGLTLLYYGEYYTLQDDFPKALDYYFQSLEIFKRINKKASIADVYKRIKVTYGYLKNKEKDDEYADLYENLEKEIRNNKRNSAGYAIKRLVDEQEQEDKSKRNKLYILIFSIVLLFSAMIYFLRKVYLKKQKKKDELLNKKEELLEKKNKTIERKSIETQKLKKRVNASFGKLVEMAKEGDPFFLTKFKEVYPDFYEKLIANNPDLTEMDIKFCAYLRLNLNNKEILQYENVNIRTLETRRYRIKKKLGLPADVDLAKWIVEL